MRRMELTMAAMVMFLGLVAPGAAQAYPELEVTCTGPYTKMVLIEEAAFPDQNPENLGRITGTQINTVVGGVKRKVETDATLSLVNRRGNRPEGEILLNHSVTGATGSHFTTADVELVEGDVVFLTTNCSYIGKAPVQHRGYLRFSVDLYGEEASDVE